MGRKRPTIRKLINLLIQVELFRAADYLAIEVLNEEPPKRPQSGPAAPIDIFVNFEEAPENQIIVRVNDCQDVQKKNYAAPSINNDNLQQVYEEEKFHAENISKFPFNSKSDLMKFSSSSSSEEKNNNYDIKYGEEQEENVLPNFKELNLQSKGEVSNKGNINSEKSSESVLSDTSDVSTCESSYQSSSSSQSAVNPQNNSIFLSDNLPVILKEINGQETNCKSIQYSYSTDSHQNLPLPILEYGG